MCVTSIALRIALLPQVASGVATALAREAQAPVPAPRAVEVPGPNAVQVCVRVCVFMSGLVYKAVRSGGARLFGALHKHFVWSRGPVSL